MTSGYWCRSGATFGSKVVLSTWSPQVMRTVPEGLSRNSESTSSSASISSKRCPMACNSRSPAAVGETLRVVRVSRRISSLASRPLMAWLKADCVTPSSAAARVKLPSRATVTNDRRSLRLRLTMFFSFSWPFD
ncbi:MAG: hypothetical protein QM748_19590 [Thauera sp.]